MRPWRLAPLAACALLLAACGQHQEGLDPSHLPPQARADYEVFAQKCSKCHTLQRPLSAQLYDDAAWAAYVARMRRQPASAISEEDAQTILRFLHYYTEEQHKKEHRAEAGP
jgi:hypothetical protein